MAADAEATRLFIDDVMAQLVTTEYHLESLLRDVETYKALLSKALTELHSQQQLNRRLMYRIEHPRG